MNIDFKPSEDSDKSERYRLFLQHYAALIEGERDEISVMANTVAALNNGAMFGTAAQLDGLVLLGRVLSGEIRTGTHTRAVPRKHCLLPYPERTWCLRYGMGEGMPSDSARCGSFSRTYRMQ